MYKILILLFILCTSLGIAQEPLALYLTWQKDPTTTMTVQWITPKEELSDTIEYQKKGTGVWQSQTGRHLEMPQQEPYLVHVTEIQGLEPNTSYSFRIGGDDKEYLFKTLPKDLTDDPFIFVVGGDTCQMSMEVFEETNARAAGEEPRFVVFGGDLAYAASKKAPGIENGKRWLEWIQRYSRTMKTPSGFLIPLLVAIGNHDVNGGSYQTPKEAAFFYTLFAMPGLPGYNVLRAGSYLSIFLLDSNHTNAVKGEQAAWLELELAKDFVTLHKFAVYHVPAYPSVRSHYAPTSISIRKHWVPLFDKLGLHVAFENNDHAYKRSYPLKGSQIDPTGTVYFGDGCWGASPRNPRTPGDSDYLAKTVSTRQYIKVSLSKRTREFWAITPQGAVVDHYIQFVKKPAFQGDTGSHPTEAEREHIVQVPDFFLRKAG